MGRYAGKNTTIASCNIILGYATGCCITTGCHNVFLARNAGKGVTTGGGNFFVGNYAGPATCGFTGNCNVAILQNSMRLKDMYLHLHALQTTFLRISSISKSYDSHQHSKNL